MRRALDLLYDAAAWLAAASLVGTLAMVLLAIAGRFLHFHLPGTDAYAGYAMAAAIFLSLAHTLRELRDLYRDEGWPFFRLGLFIERADQTSRLLDVQFAQRAAGMAELSPEQEAGFWNVLLRSASAYHAFRRVQPSGLKPDDVARIVLLGPRPARSPACRPARRTRCRSAPASAR